MTAVREVLERQRPGNLNPSTTTEDEMADHRMDEVKGRAKEAVGDLTDNDDLKREGKIDRGAAGAKEKVEEVVDKVRDKVRDATD
jgi:uncharacterized protein YjbJ (UPF0337 family)